MTSPITPTVTKIDGSGAAYCITCLGRLTYSWFVIYSDDTHAWFCSTHCPGEGDAKS